MHLYKVGGHLPLDASSYVTRQADHDLYDGLRSGEFCYVLNARQMGKTSLRVRTMHRLQAEGILGVAIDLTRIGSSDITADQWYAGLMRRIVKSLHLPLDLRDWLGDREFLPPVQRLSEFIEEVLLESVKRKLVIFIDEIDSMLSLSFRTDDFFGFLRACAEYDRLTFALLGVASPSDLIQSKTYTPFNIGRAIDLQGFQLEETQPLIQGLAAKATRPDGVMEAVLHWTGGQPFLTQKVCNLIATRPHSVPTGGERQWVEDLVRSHLIDNWEATDEPPHLKTIRDRLLRAGSRSRNLLDLYQQIVKRGEVEATDSPEQMELRLSGLVVKRGERLTVTNPIYGEVFNVAWVRRSLVSLKADFMAIVAAQEQKLLSMLNVMKGKDFAEVLQQILGSITLRLGELLSSDRTTIFFVDEEKNDIWSVIAHSERSDEPEIQVIANKGGEGRITNFRNMVNEPFQYRDESLDREELFPTRPQTDQGDRVYSELLYPLTDDAQNLVAVIQLVNKLKRANNPAEPLIHRINPQGFTEADQKQLEDYAPAILRVLARCQDCYRLTQTLQASEALTEATRSVSQSSLDAEEIIGCVMAAAKKLMNADRTTLWLLDEATRELWTKIPFGDGSMQEIRIPVGRGFAGLVAETQVSLNIPFDLYDHPDSATAQKTDQQTGYRTCSLLCMPIWNPEGKLLGVTQLINKRRQGNFPPYNPSHWPQAPECFQASFDANSERYMKLFNAQVGVALQNAREFEAVKQRAETHPQQVIAQTLQLLNQVLDNQGFDDILDTTLRKIVSQLGRELRADRATVLLFDEERQEFWSVLTESIGGDRPFTGEWLVHLPVAPFQQDSLEQRVVREVAQTRQTLRVTRTLEELENAPATPNLTYSLMASPLLDDQGNLLAIVQFHNKRYSPGSVQLPFDLRLDAQGFTPKDGDRVAANALRLRVILESFCTYHKTPRGQRVAVALMEATRSANQNTLEPRDILPRIMEAAKQLMNADRSTLWLLDRGNQRLWTQINDGQGNLKQLELQIGQGYAGRVAATGEPINIPFDLYDHPDSATARQTDEQSGYRTCSLLCMPVYDPDNELIGVTQLVNKRRSRTETSASSPLVPGIPDYFQTHFDETDQQYMQLFNNQAGIILQNAELLAALRRQEAALQSGET